MVYDFDGLPDKSAPRMAITPARPDDLEAIVTLLELAAVTLTSEPGATFTAERLIAEAMDCGGAEIGVAEADMRIVLDGAEWLKRDGALLSIK